MSPFVLLLIAVLVPLVTNAEVELVHTCVPVNFENGLEDFSGTSDLCSFVLSDWDIGHYTHVGINSPHNLSRTFIRSNIISCTSSFDFEFSASGTVEVTFFLSIQAQSEFLQFFVTERQESGQIVQANQVIFSILTPDINDGWNTIRFGVRSDGNFRGFISIIGSQLPGSTILVDSFRYIPPDYNESHKNCVLYGQEDSEKSTESKEDATTESEEDATKDSDENVTKESDEDITTDSDEDTTKESDEDVTKESDENDTNESDEDATTESKEDATKESDEDVTKESDEDATTESEENETKESDEDVTKESDEDSTTESDEDATKESEFVVNSELVIFVRNLI